jgi:hypothetical protein
MELCSGLKASSMGTRKALVLLLLVFPTAVLAGEARQLNQPPEGYEALFNGIDFENWQYNASRSTEETWRIVDGVLVKGKRGGTLRTKKEYGDCVLMLDWRWTAKPWKHRHGWLLPSGEIKTDENGKRVSYEFDMAGDSGIYFRMGQGQYQQINLWCDRVGSGELHEWRTRPDTPPEVRSKTVPIKKMDKPLGEWNSMVIHLRGEQLQVQLNGERVIDVRLPGLAPRGRFGIQDHGFPMELRNIFIKELDTGEIQP